MQDGGTRPGLLGESASLHLLPAVALAVGEDIDTVAGLTNEFVSSALCLGAYKY